jgi:carboxymethylenebutenolidase
VGFCFGGWIANMMAVKVPISSSAFMADSPLLKRTNNTATALRRFRQPINEGWPAYEAILKEQYRKHRFYLSQSWFS